jgi:hypothetical protein
LLARDEAHDRAMTSDDPALLTSFLNSYPTGSRADQIRERLRRLEPPKREDPPKPDDARGFSKKKLVIAAAVAVVVIIGIYALSSSNPSPSMSTQQISTPVPQTTYSAIAQCSRTGIIGQGTGDTEDEAEDDAVNNCVSNGGIAGCCRVIR